MAWLLIGWLLEIYPTSRLGRPTPLGYGLGIKLVVIRPSRLGVRN